MDGSFSNEKINLAHKLNEVSHQPGVYLMRDRFSHVIYVGKARDLRKRLSSYFLPSRLVKLDIKTRALVESVWNYEWHEVRNEAEALLLEGKLIKDFRPKYNISFRDDKRFLLVRVNLNDPWPRLTLTRLKKDDGSKYFGPYSNSNALRLTVTWLNRHFQLRSCRPQVPDADDHKHCHADIIKNCSAPCIGAISQVDYQNNVNAASAFLVGGGKELITGLEEEMHKAAAKLDFETAAQLRDMIQSMRATRQPNRLFTRVRGVPSANIDPTADIEQLRELLHLEKTPQTMECFDISNISTTHCVASMVRFKGGKADTSSYRRYRIRSVAGQNDFMAMAEVVRRRYSRILLQARELTDDSDHFSDTPVETAFAIIENRHRESQNKNPFVTLPDLIIVDGGKGQLNVACQELARLGLHQQAIIGLAKEFEEIYLPNRPDPIRLPHELGAPKLLQRIRDEAHRWANGYHSLLLSRRMHESRLDDCPGMSSARKEALLKFFGSVKKISQASIEELSAVKGIGKILASQIKTFLSQQPPK